jgi:hypothetical protein
MICSLCLCHGPQCCSACLCSCHPAFSASVALYAQLRLDASDIITHYSGGIVGASSTIATIVRDSSTIVGV